MAAASMRNWQNRDRRRSREFRGRRVEKFICARRIQGKCSRLDRSMKRKARSNRNRMTRSCFRNGPAWNGGDHQHRLSQERAEKRARSRGWNFLCVAETRKIREKNGRGGSARTRQPERQ